MERDKCKDCKHADRHKRYCHSWSYPRCETFDWCCRFEQDTKLNIIVRDIFWTITPEKYRKKPKYNKSDSMPYVYAGYREKQGYNKED